MRCAKSDGGRKFSAAISITCTPSEIPTIHQVECNYTELFDEGQLMGDRWQGVRVGFLQRARRCSRGATLVALTGRFFGMEQEPRVGAGVVLGGVEALVANTA